jgi:hypothetical protein
MSGLDATADLLNVAHATLRETVLPHVAAVARYEAAMVANALAIAAREVELGARAREAERDLLARFCGTPDAPLAELRARCCADLRAGGLDRAREPGLRRLLHEVVHARLAISNPAYGRGTRGR